MDSRKLLFFQLYTALAIGVLHFLGFRFSLYWLFPWYDVIQHFLGGAFVAIVAIWFLAEQEKNPRLLLVFGSVLAVGVAWEVFEVIAGIPRESNYVFDTSLDLVMDVVGAVSAFALTQAWRRTDMVS